MKKCKIIVLLLILLGITIPVHAANYEMKELIPEDITTTIRGHYFLYKDLSYSNGIVKFGTIENQSDETRKITISIGLFNEKKKNIGTINYCVEDILGPKETKTDYLIEVKGSYLVDGQKFSNIKYIAILSENENCRKEGAKDFEGQSVEEIGIAKNTSVTDSAVMLLNIIKVIAVILVALFLYKFVFTTAYRNMDGEDVRQEFTYINKQLRKKREKDLRENPPQPKVVKTHKTKEIIEQEKIQNEKDQQNDSDLHNMYK